MSRFDRSDGSRATPERGEDRHRGTPLARLAAAAALALLTLAAPLATPASAQEEPVEERVERLEQRVDSLRQRLAERDTAGIAELRRKLQAVLRELEAIRLGGDVVAADTGAFGLAPAASKIYRKEQGVSIGGYGEVLYERFSETAEDGSDAGVDDRLDALRAIVYVGYKFSDRLLFNSEIEVEHGSTSGGTGSVSVEFAYLDYMLTDDLGVRAGVVLPPMGFLNEIHEPPTFLGTERPVTESRIIPSTWREGGFGVFGRSGGFEYRAYLINGFDAVGDGASPASGFSASGLRGGRQKAAKAVAEDFAGVGRVDYKGLLPGLMVGTSFYAGEAGQNQPHPTDPTEVVSAPTLIWEAHAQYRASGFDVRGLFAWADVEEVSELNALRGLTGDQSIGSRLEGKYLQVGYDVLRHVETDHQLLPYVRWEKVNTQDQVPGGFSIDPANELTVVSLGAAWKPVPGAILKADYQVRDNEADTGVDQLNVALGYLF